MISYRIAFILLTALTIVNPATDVDDDDEPERTDCGQYGFRCMDEKTLEFCPTPIDGVTLKTDIYECDDDFTCDEDNPAYCTPKEPTNKMVQDANKEPHHGVGEFSSNGDYFDEEQYYRQGRAAKPMEDGNFESTTQGDETTTETNDDDEFTTVQYAEVSPFECDAYGFFPDLKNESLFWYCDVPLNGVGYLLRHMVCGMDRVFDKMLKNCVLRDIIRKERTVSNTNKTTNNSTDCKNKKPGKYPDPLDCHIYHLCLPKQFSPAIQLTFMCQRGTAYDPTCRSCTTEAFTRCQAKEQKPSKNKSKINCRSPMRFRSTEDCDSYFLCFVDNVIEIKCPKFYKFDDFAMECLPEKVAECKEYSV